MRGRVLACLGLLVAGVVPATGCIARRANPQIKSMEQSKDGNMSSSFSYDDDGFLIEVEQIIGDGEDGYRQVIELEWADGLLDELLFDFGGSLFELELEHDDERRPARGTFAGNGSAGAYEFEYDEHGRFTSWQWRPNDAFSGRQTSTYRYNEDGAIDELTQKQESPDGTSASRTRTRYQYEGHRVVGSTRTLGSEEWTTTYDHDEHGRLALIRSTTEIEGDDEARTEIALSYDDDGNLAELRERQFWRDDETWDVRTELTYGEGEAVGLDLAPTALSFFSDLRGVSYDRIVDVRAQVPRLSLVAW